MSNTKFDLERFKAGEPAYDHLGSERIYLATAPNGNIITWNTGWDSYSDWNLDKLLEWTMKPKEEWVAVVKKEYSHLYTTIHRIHPYKKAVESYIKGYYDPTHWEAVKIIRE